MTFVQSINQALADSLAHDNNVLVCGQMPKYGIAGLTVGLYERFPGRVISYPVSEALMNSSAMGLALAGKRVVMCHVRIDFLATGMDALVNHIPVWFKKGFKLPIVILCQIGRGMGQGPQHSKDLTLFFANFEGWRVIKPFSPDNAYHSMKDAIFGNQPTIFAVHRELFNSDATVSNTIPDRIRLCGASRRHEQEFYGG